MKKVVMQLETLSCPSCMKKIQGALEHREGVESAAVLFNSSKAKASFDEAVVSAEELKETIESLGYEVKSVKTA